jgi:hypothetical protein
MPSTTFTLLHDEGVEICGECDKLRVKSSKRRCCKGMQTFDVGSLLDAEMIYIDDKAKNISVVIERVLIF